MSRRAAAAGAILSLLLSSGVAGAQDAGATDAGERTAPDGGLATTPAPAPPAEEPLPAEHEPRLTVQIEPESGLMTGDVVTLRVVADALEGDDLAVPPQSFEPFEVRDQRVTQEPTGAGRVTWRFEVDLLAFEPGDHELPPLRLRVVTTDGEIGHARTEAIRLSVGSLLGNEPDAQPKPPTAPVQVLEKDYSLLWILGGLAVILLTALVTLLLARWWRRRPRAAPPPPPPRPVWEIAYDKLAELGRTQQTMFEEGRSVEWVDGLSDALREYLGGRYGFDGLESTTDEVLSRLRRLQPSGVALAELTTVLGECDLVKFARADVEIDQGGELLEQAVGIVRKTTPPIDYAARGAGATS